MPSGELSAWSKGVRFSVWPEYSTKRGRVCGGDEQICAYLLKTKASYR